ncbi:MAG TPA: murein L,D-transpeptidase catalytic domain family protein [Acetobacteraceae bacterium]|nr:murein L,D-transpeptidase catalytic domain family protein [Acetobacteraceae bacterium]
MVVLPILTHAAPDLPAQVAQHAAIAYACEGAENRLLMVADMSQRNTRPRFWAFDVRNPAQPRLLIESRIEHGAGSDPDKSGYATRFSNADGSGETSLGLYRLTDPYESPTHGRSYHLRGLTPGWNSNAEARDVEFHPSHFVDTDRVDWSLGCLATPMRVIPALEKAVHSLSGAIVWVDGPRAVPLPCHTTWTEPTWPDATSAWPAYTLWGSDTTTACTV